MFFRFYFVIVLLLMSGCAQQKKVFIKMPAVANVLILSKYKLDQFTLRLESAHIISSTKSLNLKEQTLIIKKAAEEITLQGSQFVLDSTYIEIVSDADMIIEFKDRNGMQQKRVYTGELTLSINKELQINIVNRLPFELYVHQVAYAESASLLKALAPDDEKYNRLLSIMETVVRSYLLAHSERHGSPYSYCDLTHCAHFPGITTQNISSLKPGQVLTDHKGKILPTFFHSCCGGRLSGAEIIWPGHSYYKEFRRGDDSPLIGKDYCHASPHYRWQSQISKYEMNRLLGTDVVAIQLHKENLVGTGRIASLTFYNQQAQGQKLSCAKFLSITGRDLGWSRLKSNFFKISDQGDYWLFDGKGFGHGVGLCQWGAFTMVKQDFLAQEILDHYYPGAVLVTIDK